MELADFYEMFGPNILYTVLMVAIWLTVTAIYVPGTGFPEGGALLAGAYAILGLIVGSGNLIGLLLLALSLGCFLALVFYRRYRWLIVAGFILQVLGSLFCFKAGSRPDFLVIVGVIALSVAYHQLILFPGLRAQDRTSTVGGDALIGRMGRVVRTIEKTGLVLIEGETWQAVSGEVVDRGQWVRVTGRDGLLLTVEPAQPNPDTALPE